MVNHFFHFYIGLSLRKLFFFILLFPLPCLSNTIHRAVQYDIAYSEKSQEPCLDIFLATYSNEKGEALLQFPKGDTRIQFIFQEETLLPSQQGEAYRKVKKNPRLIHIHIRPHKKFYVNYQFCLKNFANLPTYPIIEKDFISAQLSDILAFPADYTANEWDIFLYLGQMPKTFTFVNSFDSTNKREFSLKKSLLTFRREVIVGGKDLPLENITTQAGSVRIVNKGQWYGNKPLAFYLQKLIQSQRSFWHDSDFPHYLGVFLPSPLDQCDEEIPAIAGVHQLNAFLIQTPYCKRQQRSHFFWLLSHELFHAWMGGKMGIRTKDTAALRWFIEGFNDYYGLRFALESGLINYSDYVKIYNELLRSYYLIPFNRISNEEIIEKDHKDTQYQYLAQLRGHFLAKELSARLTQEESSLDAIIKEIYAQSRKTEFLKKEIIDAIFAKHLNASLQTYVKEKIEMGKPFFFSDKALGIFSTLVNKRVKVPDFGFDLNAFFESQHIHGLNLESAAFKAGLREGQKVTWHNINLAHADVKVTFEVEEDGKKKQIRFHPDIVQKAIPQYVLKT